MWAQKQKEMAAIFDSYFIQLQEIVQQQDVDSEIQQKMLDEERKRFLHFLLFFQCVTFFTDLHSVNNNCLEVKMRLQIYCGVKLKLEMMF